MENNVASRELTRNEKLFLARTWNRMMRPELTEDQVFARARKNVDIHCDGIRFSGAMLVAPYQRDKVGKWCKSSVIVMVLTDDSRILAVEQFCDEQEPWNCLWTLLLSDGAQVNEFPVRFYEVLS